MNDYLYHGTSLHCLRCIITGDGDALPTYDGELQSLGGTYLADTPSRASVGAYERTRTFPEEGKEVVIVLKPMFELFPDEDWVSVYRTRSFQTVLAEGGHGEVVPFFNDLLADYPGDVWNVEDPISLVTHYLSRFDDLNHKHAITGNVSLGCYGTARQKERLTPEQVIAAFDWRAREVIDLDALQ